MPDFSDNRTFMRLVTFTMVAVAVAIVGFAASAAQAFIAPVVLALVTGVVLAPLSDFWERLGLPRSLGAMISLLTTLLLVAVLALALQPIAVKMIERFPIIMSDISSEVEEFRAMFQDIDEATQEVMNGGAESEEGDPAAARGDGGGEQEAAPAEDMTPSVTDAIMLAPSILAMIAIYAGTLFFFLATRPEIYRWLPAAFEGLTLKRLRNAERRVSRYFLTITMINATLGVAVGAVQTAIGLEGALQWGLLAFFVNFVVYLGPAVFAASLLLAGIAQFDGFMAVLPAAAYLCLNFTEGQFVTPTLVGSQMRINPLIVFLSVTFGLWFWGAPGGIVAIPILVWMIEMGATSPHKRRRDIAAKRTARDARAALKGG